MTSDALLQAWEKTWARRAGDAAVYDVAGTVWRTFGDIAAETAEFEGGILGDLAPGTVVAFQLGNQPTFLALLLSCLQRRLVVLPLERTMAEREREAAMEICHVQAIATDSAASGKVAIALRAASPIVWGHQRPTLLKLTSGTTAAPRAIRFRSEQLLADCTQICDTMGITEHDLHFGVIPVSHSYGFSSLITPLIALGVPLALSRDRMPRAVLDGLARTGATVFPGMPVFYQAFSEMAHPPDLLRLRLCISAGAPLPLPVALRFQAAFGHAIHSFYGSSECGGICYDRAGSLLEQGFVGAPMQNVAVELLEPEANMSRVRVSSSAAGDGYFPEPETWRLGNGEFMPDDLLVAQPDGFRVAGRVSDVINVAGKKVNPAEVEAALLEFVGVRQAVVFGRESSLRNEEIIACVVSDSGVTETALLAFCRERLSGWQVPKRILFVLEIPVTERGKVSRRELGERFAAASTAPDTIS